MTTSLFVLLYGDGGTGKSTLACSAPGPRLLIDTEFRSDNLENTVVWDGKTKLEGLTPETTVVFYAKSITDLRRATQILRTAGQPFKSWILDSITELQQQILDAEFPDVVKYEFSHWGFLLNQIRPELNKLKALTKDPATGVEMGIVTCWSKESGPEDNKKILPLIQGQMANRMKHMTDLIGYVSMRENSIGITQTMHIAPVNNIYAKDSYGHLVKKYGKSVTSPNLTQLLHDTAKETTHA